MLTLPLKVLKKIRKNTARPGSDDLGEQAKTERHGDQRDHLRYAAAELRLTMNGFSVFAMVRLWLRSRPTRKPVLVATTGPGQGRASRRDQMRQQEARLCAEGPFPQLQRNQRRPADEERIQKVFLTR